VGPGPGLLTQLPGTIARLRQATQRHFVLGERETRRLARKVCDLEKEPVSRRQVCWK